MLNTYHLNFRNKILPIWLWIWNSPKRLPGSVKIQAPNKATCNTRL